MNDPAEKEIDQHDTLFSSPLQFFSPTPFNDIFLETREDEIFPIPKDPYSDVFTFTRHGNSVGLMKTSEAKITADISIRKQNGTQGGGNAEVVVPPLPLRTLWKTKELKLNDNLVTPADNFSFYGSYIAFITREVPSMYKDSKEVNCAYLDTQGHMNTHMGDNTGSLARHTLTNNTVATLVDQIDLTCFSEGGGETFLPSAFKTEIRLTRANNNLICMGADHGDLAAADAKISIDNFKMKIPIFKPKDQLTNALNTSFVKNQQEAKYYTTTFRTVTATVPAGRRSLIENDIFNGSCPVRLFCLYSRQNNFNGTFATNVFNFAWENYSSFTISVNNVTVSTLKNQVEAYQQLRDVLNRSHSEMPISYQDFIHGYAIVAFDLTSNHDTHLKVLPNRPSGVVNAHIEFSQDTAAGTMLFVGEFRNEIKVGIKTPARLLYDI